MAPSSAGSGGLSDSDMQIAMFSSNPAYTADIAIYDMGNVARYEAVRMDNDNLYTLGEADEEEEEEDSTAVYQMASQDTPS